MWKTLEKPDQPATKRDRVVFLLHHYRDFFEISSNGAGAGDDRIPMLPPMAHHPSVVELVRCLAVLEVKAPKAYRHTKAFFTAETRTVDVLTKRKAKKGTVTVPVRRAVPLVPRWVRQERVLRGVELVAENFRGSVYFPDELKEAA